MLVQLHYPPVGAPVFAITKRHVGAQLVLLVDGGAKPLRLACAP
eukprot:COSAG05_NODE_275_length_12406_cov_12.621841_5_plen_44_part_00